MKILILLLCFVSSNLYAEVLCKKEDLKYPEGLPLDFRWHESDFNRQAAEEAIKYLTKIVNGDLSSYHWITQSHSEMVIKGYTYKLLALKELSAKDVKHRYEVSSFCSWLSNATKAD